MTYVSTPSPGAIPQEERSRRTGTKLVAVALTVAAGAAIAFGATVVTDDAAPIPVVNENPELLKHNQATDDVANVGGRRTPRGYGGAAAASQMSNEQFTQYLIDIGRLPQGAIPTGTQPVESNGSGPR